MFEYIVECLDIFFIVLQVILLVYVLQTVIYMGTFLRRAAYVLAAPMLAPMQRLVRRSVMNTFSVDLSPYILLIILYYLERLCAYLV